MYYTDVLCLHLNRPQEGSQDCVVPVRIIHHACGLCMTPVKDRLLGADWTRKLSWSLHAVC